MNFLIILIHKINGMVDTQMSVVFQGSKGCFISSPLICNDRCARINIFKNNSNYCLRIAIRNRNNERFLVPLSIPPMYHSPFVNLPLLYFLLKNKLSSISTILGVPSELTPPTSSHMFTNSFSYLICI
jgi:hypothetical protein